MLSGDEKLRHQEAGLRGKHAGREALRKRLPGITVWQFVKIILS